MKKLFTLSYFVLLISYSLFAQSVGIGTNTPAASALLDVTATNKGILVPRVTNAQMLAITLPANGLLVYNTDSAAFAYRNATAWVFIRGNTTASNDWSTKGNAGTDTSKNFIGTTDDEDVIFKRNNEQAGWLNESSKNTGWGAGSLSTVTTGFNNTSNGYHALQLNSIGYNNTANGSQVLAKNDIGSRNTASGFAALNSNISGNDNTAMGTQALLLNTDGYSNVAVGVSALRNSTVQSNIVAVGDSALYNNGTGATESYQAIKNTAVGSKALYSNTTGNGNSAFGFEALKNNTSGVENTAVGYKALLNNSGSYNTVMGWYAMSEASSGAANVAFGYRSLLSSNGSGNIGIGNDILRSNETGNDNTAVGTEAMNVNNGNNNAALGHSAGFNNIGSSNIFIGYKAGYNEAGSNKLYISNDATEANNTLIYGEFDNKILSVGGKLGVGMMPAPGDFPLQVKGDGSVSAFIKFFDNAGTPKWHLSMYGQSVDGNGLNFTETGVADFRLFLKAGGEVGIGKEPLSTNDDSRLQIKQKGSQNGIGVEASNSTNHWDFYATSDVAATKFNLYYNGAFKGAFDNVTGAYTAVSDRRLKKDITTQPQALNNLMQLQAYQYHYLDNKSTDNFSNGFMAQDVQKLFPDAVVENVMKSGEKRLGINYQYFTVLAIKGLQEQQKIIETQTSNIQQQEQRIAKLEAAINTLLPKN